MSDFRVCELFAGVGGFRLGLEKTGWSVIWSNQWEPSTKAQHASECYELHFGQGGHVNEDIAKVPIEEIPDHSLLVGGFPCQDYSVAATNAQGITGKKGVLWWEIYRILRGKRPPYVLLENVDRLLVSPSKQRGRDLAIMLACFRDLDYTVEWRVINAADYGFPQKRRRVFFFAYSNDSFISNILNQGTLQKRINKTGFFSRVFPVIQPKSITLFEDYYAFSDDVVSISDNFAYRFFNAGIMSDGRLYTEKLTPVVEPVRPMQTVLEKDVPESFFIDDKDLELWRYMKGSKRESRVTKEGFEYVYAEGAIPFPDDIDGPSRTLLTSEGNKRPNRMSHIIEDPQNGRFRKITPVEAERLNGFPDGWTDTGMSLNKRYFCMGNALVVGIIERMGDALSRLLNNKTSLNSNPEDINAR